MSECVQPFTGLPVLPVVSDVVVHADPWALEAIDELDELGRFLFGWSIVVVVKFVPYIFDENWLS